MVSVLFLTVECTALTLVCGARALFSHWLQRVVARRAFHLKPVPICRSLFGSIL